MVSSAHRKEHDNAEARNVSLLQRKLRRGHALLRKDTGRKTGHDEGEGLARRRKDAAGNREPGPALAAGLRGRRSDGIGLDGLESVSRDGWIRDLRLLSQGRRCEAHV